MPTLNGVAPKYFRRPNNAAVLAAIQKNASNAYQTRVPAPTKASIQATQEHLLDGRNKPDWNEFTDALLNRIGLELFRVQQFKNPLAKFNSGDLRFGDTIEEIAYGLAEAYVYDVDRDYLEKSIFGQERPEVQAAYHKINRQNYYKLTINEPMLRRAFNSEYGLSEYIAGQMEILSNSDELDQYLIMTSLFKEYYDNGGFFKVNVPNIGADASTEADAKKFLRKARAFADNLTILSRHYNAAGLPVKASREELELFITPEANAAIDVEALAAAFNVESTSMPFRITVIPAEHFRIPGVQAVLTTRDFFIVADSFYQVNRVDNPVGLYENHFLHHHQVISTSLFVPAILFYTGPGDTIVINETPVTDVSAIVVTDRNGTTVTSLERGEVYAIDASAITAPTGGANDSVKFDFQENGRPNSTHTFIRQEGRTLYVAIDEGATALIIRATATDNNAQTETLSLPVVGERITLWPNPNTQITSGVTFTDAGDIVTVPSHGASVGDKITFGAITGTTGVAAGVEYFVKTAPTADTLTISATDGGATLALTTNGTAASATIYNVA